MTIHQLRSDYNDLLDRIFRQMAKRDRAILSVTKDEHDERIKQLQKEARRIDHIINTRLTLAYHQLIANR